MLPTNGKRCDRDGGLLFRERIRLARKLWHEGQSYEEIAVATGLSKERVAKLASRMRHEGRKKRKIREDMRKRFSDPRKIAEMQEPKGCRFIRGDVKNQDDWYYCQKQLVLGYMYCKEHLLRCYQRGQHITPRS